MSSEMKTETGFRFGTRHPREINYKTTRTLRRGLSRSFRPQELEPCPLTYGVSRFNITILPRGSYFNQSQLQMGGHVPSSNPLHATREVASTRSSTGVWPGG
jgi:hypothetical protein